MIFVDRTHAARELAQKLIEQKGKNPLVLAIPRGAIPIAKIIAEALDGELDIELVHKFALRKNPEFALGSVSENGKIYLGVGAERYNFDEKDIEAEARIEIERLKEKRRLYTPHREPIDPRGRLVILVDDGIATGATLTAAIRDLQQKGVSRIIVASPVASKEGVIRLLNEGAEVVTLEIPENFAAVSQFYEDFSQISDQQVMQALSPH